MSYISFDDIKHLFWALQNGVGFYKANNITPHSYSTLRNFYEDRVLNDFLCKICQIP